MVYDKNRKREEYEREWESTEAYAITQDVENFTVGERAFVRWCGHRAKDFSKRNTAPYLLEDLESSVFIYLVEMGLFCHSKQMESLYKNLGSYVDALFDAKTGKLKKKIEEKGYRYDLVDYISCVSY